MSIVWNIYQEKLKNNQTLTKEAWRFLWCPVKDFNISDIFHQIQKFLRASYASIITTNGINFLMAGLFKKKNIYIYMKRAGEATETHKIALFPPTVYC